MNTAYLIITCQAIIVLGTILQMCFNYSTKPTHLGRWLNQGLILLQAVTVVAAQLFILGYRF